jgi:hypothetical protein
MAGVCIAFMAALGLGMLHSRRFVAI